MSVSVETPMLLGIDAVVKKDTRTTETSSFLFLAKPRAMISKMPGICSHSIKTIKKKTRNIFKFVDDMVFFGVK
jgi:hypothetical protein